MKPQLQALCDAFLAARDQLKSTFRMESSYLYPVCANLFCARGAAAEREQLLQCRALLRQNTSVFSNFRGSLMLPAVCLMSLSGDPQAHLDRAMAYYRALKERFFGTQYLALAAFLLADFPGEDLEAGMDRGKRIYQRMRKEHPLLTSSEDSTFAVLMGYSEESDDALIADMEACFALLKGRFAFGGNDIQAASHVLALCPGAPEEKAGRLIALYDAIRSAGGKYRREDGLGVLAAVAAQEAEISSLTADMLEADEFLSRQKGYGFFGLGRSVRMTHAAMIVCDQYAPQRMETASVAGVLALIAAQQSAMSAAAVSSATISSNS